MKFIIGTAPSATIELAGRTVRVDRASYDQILDEEDGDAVIGDVVSLDLALPLSRERAGKKHALLLTARELADLALRVIGHADAIERLHRRRPVRLRHRTQPASWQLHVWC